MRKVQSVFSYQEMTLFKCRHWTNWRFLSSSAENVPVLCGTARKGASTEMYLQELASYNGLNTLATDCHSILKTQANRYHFKATIPTRLEQTITRLKVIEWKIQKLLWVPKNGSTAQPCFNFMMDKAQRCTNVYLPSPLSQFLLGTNAGRLELKILMTGPGSLKSPTFN